MCGYGGLSGGGRVTASHRGVGQSVHTEGAGERLGRNFGHAATRRRVGFLPENIALYQRTAASAARFYGALNGIHGAALRQGVAGSFKELDLTAVPGRSSPKCSRGRTRRLGLVRAL